MSSFNHDNTHRPGSGGTYSPARLLTTAELCDRLNIGTHILRELRKAGLPAYAINAKATNIAKRRGCGMQYRYDLQAVMDWLAARNAAATSKATPEASAETPTPCATAEQKGVEA